MVESNPKAKSTRKAKKPAAGGEEEDMDALKSDVASFAPSLCFLPGPGNSSGFDDSDFRKSGLGRIHRYAGWTTAYLGPWGHGHTLGYSRCLFFRSRLYNEINKVQVRIWRRPGHAVDRATAEHLFEVINAREDVLRRLRRLIYRCAYLKYVEGRLGDRMLYADEILRDGFCLNMIDTPLCPLTVVTNLQEAVWDTDIVINGLPSTETRDVFGEIGRYWEERITVPVIISLAKGIEASLDPVPRIAGSLP